MTLSQPHVDLRVFRVDPEILSLLDDMEREDLIAFAELHNSPSTPDQVELHIYSCCLTFVRFLSTEHLITAIQHAEGWIAVTEADDGDRGRRFDILNLLTSLKSEYTYIDDDVADRIRVRFGTRDKDAPTSDRLKRAAENAYDNAADLPHSDPRWAQSIMELGRAFYASFEQSSSLHDLKSAQEFAGIAIEAIPFDSPDRPVWINELKSWLEIEAQDSASLGDLDASTRLPKTAIEVDPHSGTGRALLLSNASGLLTKEFQTTGRFEVLNRAIELAQKAVDAVRPDSDEYTAANQAGLLRDLGHLLSLRYDNTGSMDDLQRAIDVSERAVYMHQGGGDWGYRLGALGGALARRMQRTKSMNDFERAQHFLRQAVDEDYPPDDPHVNEPYANLSCIYLLRYTLKGKDNDLRVARELMNLALSVMSKDHPDRPERLANLSAIYVTQFESSFAMEDLDKGLEICEEAILKLPKDHPTRAGVLNNRGLLLYHRSKVTKADEDEALHLATLLETWKFPNARPTTRILAAMDAAHILSSQCKWEEASSLFEEAVSLLPAVSPRFLKNTDKQHELQPFVSLGPDAAAAALQAKKDPSHALQLLENGRNMISSALMEVRSDLSDLEQAYPELAAKFIRLRGVLNSPEKGPEAGSSTASLLPDADRDLRKLIHQIRDKSGFEHFLLPPTAEAFMAAANPDPIVVINATRMRSDAFLVERDRIRALELPGLTAQELYTRITATKAPTLGESASGVSLEWLWDTACGPILNELGFSAPITDDNWPRVWWVPTGILSIVPLHAAGYHQPGSKNTVIDRVMSSYSISIKSLIHGRKFHAQQQGIAPSNRAVVVAMRDTPGLAVSGALPFAAAEAEMLAMACSRMGLELCTPKPRKVDVLDALQSSRIFHFAGHGAPNHVDPSYGRLLLEDWQSDPLTVEDIHNVRFSNSRPFLGYLSACSTGINENGRLLNEGIHLVSSFQMAGFRHVVGTLWEVNDKYCVDVARVLYETLGQEGFNDLSVCRGLHRATRALRAGRLEDIHVDRKATLLGFGAQEMRPVNSYWVPFIHYGTLSNNSAETAQGSR